MKKWANLTPAAIHQIAWEIRDGEADPEDARRLLELFCECRDGSCPPELIQHLRSAFSAYLEGRRTIESALGLARRKGRPKADADMRQRMAAEILRYRLAGMSHQECLARVSEKFGWGETIVGEAWRDNQQNALIILRLERALNEYPWTASEVERLNEIFASAQWFIGSGKSPNKVT